MIDLRSDTVTQPTEAMREAMRRADVGDDVYGEDPTVRQLEELAADRMGKEAAVFVPTGTMGNLAAVLVHTRRGDEIIVEHQAHMFLNEAGGMSAVAGVIPRPVAGDRGALLPEHVVGVLRPRDAHFAPTRLVCLENTHNRAGGTVMTPEQMHAVYSVAHEHGLRVHLDGARIFNAAVALRMGARVLARDVDSVTFCVSKGLSAPVGSVLAGSGAFIEEARRARKLLGGGMRQAGVIAAAGIVALETMVDRLAEDHRHARLLAAGLAAIPRVRVDLPSVQTNMVMVEVDDAREIVTRLASRGILAHDVGPRRIRLVTHRHISRADVDETIGVFEEIVSMKAGKP